MVVVQVEKDSPAAAAGIQRGMVVLALDGVSWRTRRIISPAWARWLPAKK